VPRMPPKPPVEAWVVLMSVTQRSMLSWAELRSLISVMACAEAAVVKGGGRQGKGCESRRMRLLLYRQLVAHVATPPRMHELLRVNPVVRHMRALMVFQPQGAPQVGKSAPQPATRTHWRGWPGCSFATTSLLPAAHASELYAHRLTAPRKPERTCLSEPY
jgi:hypothetical protein